VNPTADPRAAARASGLLVQRLVGKLVFVMAVLSGFLCLWFSRRGNCDWQAAVLRSALAMTACAMAGWLVSRPLCKALIPLPESPAPGPAAAGPAARAQPAVRPVPARAATGR
jgi:hypothetical protein